MRLPPRTGWMSAQSQPPVNGGPDAVYEVRCLRYWPDGRVVARSKLDIEETTCPHCQWRGLTKPAQMAKGT